MNVNPFLINTGINPGVNGTQNPITNRFNGFYFLGGQIELIIRSLVIVIYLLFAF
jgi:hypothetical protein